MSFEHISTTGSEVLEPSPADSMAAETMVASGLAAEPYEAEEVIAPSLAELAAIEQESPDDSVDDTHADEVRSSTLQGKARRMLYART